MTKTERILQNIKTLSDLLDRGVITYGTWSVENSRLRAELARETGSKTAKKLTDEEDE